MQRTCLAILVSLFVFLLLSAAADRAEAQVLDADTIKAGLRTDTREENGFVDRVVALARQGTLPVRMVHTTFLWARAKPRYRFQYFRRAMIIRAARIGVRL
jgi:hypothetical protein